MGEPLYSYPVLGVRGRDRQTERGRGDVGVGEKGVGANGRKNGGLDNVCRCKHVWVCVCL